MKKWLKDLINGLFADSDSDKDLVGPRGARLLAEKSNKELKIVLRQIKETAGKGETSLWLKGYCKSTGDDLEVRKLLKGLNFGLNKPGSVDGTLVIYW